MGSFSIALNFEDGVTRFVSTRPGETIMDAAYRERINIPVDCRDGACGTCKSFCETGRFEVGSYLDEALSEEEAAEGYCLPCQMRATSDCVLRIPASSAVCKVQTRSLVAVVRAVEQLSPSTVALSLELHQPGVLNFLAGQYVHVGVPGSDRHRAYSFSSPPGALIAEFLVRNLPGGLMSGYLAGRARVGDSIVIEGPYGSFYLRPVERPVLMLAGGTGLAPLLSMLQQLAGMGTQHPVHLVYGVTNDADLVRMDVLTELKRKLPLFGYTTCVASTDSAHERKGFVTQHLPEDLLASGAVDIYLCGPPPMVEAVRAELKGRGIEPASFHYEKFARSEETHA